MAKTLGEIINSLLETPKMNRWEYKTEIISPSVTPLIDFLNQQGQDGWEYVEREKVNTGTYKIIFKRKIQPSK